MMENPSRRQTNGNMLDRVACILDAVRAIEVEHLEELIQQAHECDIRQIEDPPEPFPIPRQALRMFWHFRCNLESAEGRAPHG